MQPLWTLIPVDLLSIDECIMLHSLHDVKFLAIAIFVVMSFCVLI